MAQSPREKPLRWCAKTRDRIPAGRTGTASCDPVHETMSEASIISDFREEKQKQRSSEAGQSRQDSRSAKKWMNALFAITRTTAAVNEEKALDGGLSRNAGGGFQGAVEMCATPMAPCSKLEGGRDGHVYRATATRMMSLEGAPHAAGWRSPASSVPLTLASDEIDGHAETLRILQGLPPRMPVGVDMARMRSRFGTRGWRGRTGFREGWLVGFLPQLAAAARRRPARQWRNNSPVPRLFKERPVGRDQRAGALPEAERCVQAEAEGRSARTVAARSCCDDTFKPRL